MFGDENENYITPLNLIKITIVDEVASEGKISEFHKMICNKINPDYRDKLKILYLSKINDIYQNISLTIEDKQSQGLINTQWIDEISNQRPSIILLYHYIKENSNKEEEENKIRKKIEEIFKHDNCVYIYLFIICPPENPNGPNENYNSLKDDDKNNPHCLRKLLAKDFIYIFPTKEIWKYIELTKLCNNLILCSRDYYRKIKNKISEARDNSLNTEEMIKYDIMLGILSLIKSKKKESCVSKHLKEAYDIICSKSFDHKKYYYGKPENVKFNFFEIRAVADWLLFKIMKLNFKIRDNISVKDKKKQQPNFNVPKNMDSQTKIDIFQNHVNIFSSFDYYNGETDPFYIFKYYWIFERYNNLVDFFEKNINEFKDNRKYFELIGKINFKILYNLIKMINYSKKYFSYLDINNTTINDYPVPVASILTRQNIYYAKPPIYLYEDVESKKKFEIGFNADIYLKKFLLKNEMTLDKLYDKLQNQIMPRILTFFQNLNGRISSPFPLNKCSLDIMKNKGIQFYMFVLKLMTCEELVNKDYLYSDEKINTSIFELYKIIYNWKHIKKFNKIYVHFLNKYVDSLIHQLEIGVVFDDIKKTSLFEALSELSSKKILNEKEEKIFSQLLNENFNTQKEETNNNKNNNISTPNPDEELYENINEDKNNIIIDFDLCNNNKNKSFNFEYDIKDIEKSQERKILDLVEYEFKLSTILPNIKIKFDNIKIYFICINEDPNATNKTQKEIILKEYSSEELSNIELSKNTPLQLEHKIFLKYKKGKLYVSKFEFTFANKKNLIYSVDIPNEVKKVIFISKFTENVLVFKYNKSLKVGTNQLVPFEFFINKAKIDDVEIKDLKIQFETIPTFIFCENVGQQSNDFNVNKTLTKPNLLIKRDKELSKPKELKYSKISVQNETRTTISGNIPTTPLNSNFNVRASLEVKSFDLNAENEKKLSGEGLELPGGEVSFNSIKNKNQKQMLAEPIFYVYDEKEKKLNEYRNSVEILYNNFEERLIKGKNNYCTLLKFIYEGSYKIKFSIVYFIRHKEIEDYIEYSDESILDFNVVKPFSSQNEITSNNYLEKKISKVIEEKPDYFTNQKIFIKFIISNKIDQDIFIKNISINLKNEKPILFIKSYLNEFMKMDDIDEKTKKEILTIKKNSSYTLPFLTEFPNIFSGSIGSIKMEWTTENLQNFENGSLNLINSNTFDFPKISVRPQEIKYSYNTEILENKQIKVKIKIKNISNKVKKVNFGVSTRAELSFIMIGFSKKYYILKKNEEVSFEYILIPKNLGELSYPFIKIGERDIITGKKISDNYYYPEQLAFI